MRRNRLDTEEQENEEELWRKQHTDTLRTFSLTYQLPHTDKWGFKDWDHMQEERTDTFRIEVRSEFGRDQEEMGRGVFTFVARIERACPIVDECLSGPKQPGGDYMWSNRLNMRGEVAVFSGTYSTRDVFIDVLENLLSEAHQSPHRSCIRKSFPKASIGAIKDKLAVELLMYGLTQLQGSGRVNGSRVAVEVKGRHAAIVAYMFKGLSFEEDREDPTFMVADIDEVIDTCKERVDDHYDDLGEKRVKLGNCLSCNGRQQEMLREKHNHANIFCSEECKAVHYLL